MLRLAKLTQPNYRALARTSRQPQLLTIPYSHFCELGRWALDISGTKHVEHGFSPGAHVLPVLNLRLGTTERILARSSKVQKTKKGSAGKLVAPPGQGDARGGRFVF